LSLGYTLAIILFCLIAQGFFSGSEIAIIASDKDRLKVNAGRSKAAKFALKLLENPQILLATTLTGTNLAVITSTVTATGFLIDRFGEYGEVITFLIMSPLLLIFGEIIPKSIFQQKATKIALKVAYILWLASRILFPIVFLTSRTIRLFFRLFGSNEVSLSPFIKREELKLILDSTSTESDLRDKEKRLINKIFKFTESTVHDVMVSLVNITAMNDRSTVGEAVDIINEKGFSRIPIYRDRIDNMFGIIHSFDLLGLSRDRSIRDLVRKVPFVPKYKRIDELLISLQKSGNAMAIVVDEYGGTVGIITVEDILEQIVGEITDEYDHMEEWIRKLDEKKFLVNARTEIEHVNENLGISLPKEDYETLSGFLLKKMGRIPTEGEVFRYQNMKITIKKASPKSIEMVEIEKDFVSHEIY